MQILFDEIMADSTADSNCRLAVTGRIPCKRDARIEILVMGIDAGLPIEGRISGIREARRTIRNHGTSLICVKSGQAEVIHIPLGKDHRQKWLPPKAIRQRQPWRHFPGVLSVESKEILSDVQRIGIRLPELSDGSYQEVRHS